MKRLPIGVRLTLWYVAIFALGELIFGLGMWLILRHNLYDIVDDGIESQIEDLNNWLRVQQESTSLTKLQSALATAYDRAHAGDFLAVYAENGEPIYLSSFLQRHNEILLPPDQVKRPLYRTLRAEGQHFRFIFEKLNVAGRVYTVEMGAAADDAVETLQVFRSYLLMFAPLLLVSAAGVGYWMSRKALAPIDALVRTAREISGTHLGRLPNVNTKDELQRLSDTLNEMLDRIEFAFQRIAQFTADASHELRTPVALMRTEAELALRQSRGEAEYKESLHHILREAERTTLLIEQLLELARADSGREALNMHPLELQPIVRSVAANWEKAATARNLQLSTEIQEQSAMVMGDEALLRRLLDILIDNALKYTPSPGSVGIAVEVREDVAAITVQDSGVGIAPEDQARIFERFYRVDKARNRSHGGVGLGLAIAQRIVVQHGGSISVESGPGNGSRFRVGLPCTADGSRNPAAGEMNCCGKDALL
jgi:heavy metal sensor kinase